MKRFINSWTGIFIVFILLYFLKGFLPPAFLTEVVIFSIYAMGCSFLIGRLGLTSFGQPAFLAFGAYGAGVYLYYFGTNSYVAILVGVLASLVINMLVGTFLVRLNSSYFTLCNQAFCVVTFFIFQKALVKWTFGDNGLLLISRMDPTPVIDLTSPRGIYLFSFIIAILVWLFFNYLMKKSVFGATCLCVKDNEEKLRFLGYKTFNIKWLAFVIANTVAGLAGALYTVYFCMVNANIANVSSASEAVAISMLGGAGTLFGPLVGSFIFIGLKDIVSRFISHWEVLVGFLLIVVMLAGEKGIVGSLESYLAKRKAKKSMMQPALTKEGGL
ncbi:MAG TPA: branched-chain amino acid ABC transporter permease [Firmicutes bacterium]|jgi:branched-chain amino acid transport system permease protein|nr:branched-chain amino acid ABC transporter permease [Bacillota bacterium]